MRQNTNLTKYTLAILLTLAVCGGGFSAAGAQPPVTDNSSDFECEPLVTYDVSGYGIAGPIHQHVAVYSNGLTTYSALSLTGVSADFTWVSPSRAAELNDDLISAGALELPDNWIGGVADVPTTTIVVFSGNQANALHNTFSFFDIDPSDEYGTIVDILERFVARAFPD